MAAKFEWETKLQWRNDFYLPALYPTSLSDKAIILRDIGSWGGNAEIGLII
jgi:hypothetical protein